MTTRRAFLETLAATGIVAALPRFARASAAPAVAPNDAMLRPTGWGVCVPPQAGIETMTRALGLLAPARWQSYGTWPDVAYPGRIPVVFSEQYFNRATVAAWLRDKPGCVWMLPNEPEGAGQANMTPAQGVALTLEFIALGQASGQRWQWCSPQVSLTPEGLAWLTEYVTIMRQYKGIMQPAYWCVHPYRSGSLAQFRASWVAWRSWYATWGSGAPVVLSEVCAEGSPLAAQIAVMDEARAMLTRGDVCGVFWFAAHSGDGMEWPNAALTSADGATLTDPGRHWKALQ